MGDPSFQEEGLMLKRLFKLLLKGILFLPLGLFLNLLSAEAAGLDCAALEKMNEYDLVHTFLKASHKEKSSCLMHDPLRVETDQITRMVFNLVLRMNGLPKEFKDKWQKLTRDQTGVWSVPFRLCLLNQEADCPDGAALVAKNYHNRKSAIILISRERWATLTETEKFSLLWHEILGNLGLESNSYSYSTMVNFHTECNTTVFSPTSFSSECSIVAQLLDPSFIQR